MIPTTAAIAANEGVRRYSGEVLRELFAMMGRTMTHWRAGVKKYRWKSWIPGVMLIARLVIGAYSILALAAFAGAALLILGVTAFFLAGAWLLTGVIFLFNSSLALVRHVNERRQQHMS